jgi:hypothetical protein
MQVCGKEAADSYTWKDFLSFWELNNEKTKTPLNFKLDGC